MKWQLVLLAVLNGFDAALSFCLFNIFGIEMESNPLISTVLNFDNTATSFLILKLSLSIALLYYWKTASGIRSGIVLLAFIGVVEYLTMFTDGLITFLTV